MFGSGILDTVIGLMFVFLLVSMLVTIVSEMIAGARGWRAKTLREGIGRLLGASWGTQLYAHPLIEGSGRSGRSGARDGPSYIPSRSFANVVMKLVEENSAGLAAVKASLHAVLDSASATGASLETLKSDLSTAAANLRSGGGIGAAAAEDLQRRLDTPPASNTRGWLTEVQTRVHELTGAGQPSYTALLNALTSLVDNGVNGQLSVQQLRLDFDNAVSTLLTGPTTAVLRDELTAMGHRLQGPYTVGDAIADFRWFTNGLSATCLRQLLVEVPEEHTRKILLTLFDDASHDVEKFRENIEVWFNNGMDRVNGWYKRHTQVAAGVLSVITVVALNVDALAIFHHLQTDKGAREALAAKATAYVEAQKTPASAASAVAAAAVPAAATVQRSLTSGIEYKEVLQIGTTGKEGIVEITSSDNRKATIKTPNFTLDKATTEIPYTLDSDPSEQPAAFNVIFKLKGETEPMATVSYTLKPSLDSQFDNINAKLQTLALPIGWVSDERATKDDVKNGRVFWPKDGEKSPVVGHLLGWVITALAATLGAPFWFDMLNRIISIRATGKAPEEDPKAPKSVSVPVEPGQTHQEADRLRRDRR